MHLQLHSACSRRCFRWLSVLAILPILVLAAGCEEQPRNVGKKPSSQAKKKSTTPPKPEFIVGKRTQEIRNASTEVKGGGDGGVDEDHRERPDHVIWQRLCQHHRSDVDAQHAACHRFYHAENDRYPKNYDEFMNDIIKANNIALPQLPNYQKYGYNENEHKLVILEYEDLKNQPLGQ